MSEDERATGTDQSAAGGTAGTAAKPGRFSALGARLRRRDTSPDDEGPFFAPESGAQPPEAAAPRPRPRPAPARAGSEPDPEATASRPRPGPDRTDTSDETDTDTSDETDTDTSDETDTDTSDETDTDTSDETDTDTSDETDTDTSDETDTDTDTSDETDTSGPVEDDDAAGGEKDSAPEKEDKPRRSFQLRGLLRGSKLRKRIVKLVILVVVVVAAALALRTYVVAPYYIPSQSMEPALHGCPGCNNDHVLVDKLSYRFHDPHAGDIVVFDKPSNLDEPDSVLIKRVVAVGGERVVLKRGLVYVNGKRISEPYINKSCLPRPSTPETAKSKWLIPNDDVFVMGDNRCNSTDSRTFGPIKNSSIVGRAFVIVWPIKRFSFF